MFFILMLTRVLFVFWQKFHRCTHIHHATTFWSARHLIYCKCNSNTEKSRCCCCCCCRVSQNVDCWGLFQLEWVNYDNDMVFTQRVCELYVYVLCLMRCILHTPGNSLLSPWKYRTIHILCRNKISNEYFIFSSSENYEVLIFLLSLTKLLKYRHTQTQAHKCMRCGISVLHNTNEDISNVSMEF